MGLELDWIDGKPPFECLAAYIETSDGKIIIGVRAYGCEDEWECAGEEDYTNSRDIVRYCPIQIPKCLIPKLPISDGLYWLNESFTEVIGIAEVIGEYVTIYKMESRSHIRTIPKYLTLERIVQEGK